MNYLLRSVKLVVYVVIFFFVTPYFLAANFLRGCKDILIGRM